MFNCTEVVEEVVQQYMKDGLLPVSHLGEAPDDDMHTHDHDDLGDWGDYGYGVDSY